MRKVILLCALSLFQMSCQSTETFVAAANKLKTNIFGQKASTTKILGTHISQARELLGEPVGITIIDSNIQAWYYQKVFVVFRDNVVTLVEEYATPYHDISTISFAGEIPSDKRIAVVSGIQATPTEDLEFQSRTRPLKHMLKLKNYQVVEASNKPDFIALVKYGISEPMVEYHTWSTPVYKWMPGQTITTTYNSHGHSSTLTSSTNGSVEYRGERIQSQKITNFRRYLVIEVVDYKAAKKGQLKQLWKIETESIGASKDIDHILLSMYAGTSFFWEKTSRGRKTGFIAANDPMIQYLRTLL